MSPFRDRALGGVSSIFRFFSLLFLLFAANGGYSFFAPPPLFVLGGISFSLALVGW